MKFKNIEMKDPYIWAFISLVLTVLRDYQLFTVGQLNGVSAQTQLLSLVVALNLVSSALTDYIANNTRLSNEKLPALLLLFAGGALTIPFFYSAVACYLLASVAIASAISAQVTQGKYSFGNRVACAETLTLVLLLWAMPKHASIEAIAAIRLITGYLLVSGYKLQLLKFHKTTTINSRFSIGLFALNAFFLLNLAAINHACLLSAEGSLEIGYFRLLMYSGAAIAVLFNPVADLFSRKIQSVQVYAGWVTYGIIAATVASLMHIIFDFKSGVFAQFFVPSFSIAASFLGIFLVRLYTRLK